MTTLENKYDVFGLEYVETRGCFIISIDRKQLPEIEPASLYISASFSFRLACRQIFRTRCDDCRVFNYDDEYVIISVPLPLTILRDPSANILDLSIRIDEKWYISITKRAAQLRNPYRPQEETIIQVPVPESEKKRTDDIEEIVHKILHQCANTPNVTANVVTSTSETENQHLLNEAFSTETFHMITQNGPVGILWMDEKSWNKMNKPPENPLFQVADVTCFPPDVNLAFLIADVAMAAYARYEESAAYVTATHGLEKRFGLTPELLYCVEIDKFCEYVKSAATNWSLKYEPPLPKLTNYVLGTYHVLIAERQHPIHPAFDVVRYAPLAKYYGILPRNPYYSKTIVWVDGTLVKYTLRDVNGAVVEEEGCVSYSNEELRDFTRFYNNLKERALLLNNRPEDLSSLSEIMREKIETVLTKLPITITYTENLERIIQHPIFPGKNVIYSGRWTTSTHADEKITTRSLEHFFPS